MSKLSKQYITKHILKRLSNKGQRELISFLEAYKYRYLDNNKSEYLFLLSNSYTKLVAQNIIIEYIGIPKSHWSDFITVCGKKDDFKRHIACIAYKNENEELKSVVDRIKKFDDLYKWIYTNKFFILKEYIELLVGTKEYSTYCINPPLKEYIWNLYRKICKNEREKKRHLRQKYPPQLNNDFYEEMEKMFF